MPLPLLVGGIVKQRGLASNMSAVPWETVADSFLFARAIGDRVLSQGGTFIETSVTKIAPAPAGAALRPGDGRALHARQPMLAAGAWSKPLAAQLGDRVPLDTERGCNTTLPSDAFDLKPPLIFSGHGFVITRLATGIRIGGVVELAELDLPPNFARSRAMLRKAKMFLPDLKVEGGREWMGHRPPLPCSLLVSGGAPLLHAFGVPVPAIE